MCEKKKDKIICAEIFTERKMCEKKKFIKIFKKKKFAKRKSL